MEELFITLAVAMIGGAIGSFLNVVIWRLPEGMSLVKPDSHCPRCGHPIRFYDNIPILGWFMLGGRCRDCHEPISIRYPFVETLGFFIAGYFCYAIVVCGWTPFPDSLLYWNGMAEWLASGSDSEWVTHCPDSIRIHSMIVIALWCSVFYYLMTLGFIEYDQKQVPNVLLGIGLLLLLLICFFSQILWGVMIGDFPPDNLALRPVMTRILSVFLHGTLPMMIGLYLMPKNQRWEWALAGALIVLVYGIGFSSDVSPKWLTPRACFADILILASAFLSLIIRKITGKSMPAMILFVLGLLLLIWV